MAAGIGNALGLERVLFSSAGMAPHPVDPETVQFMRGKGIDISRQTSKYLNQIVDLENYAVDIALGEKVESLLKAGMENREHCLGIRNPSKLKGSEAEISRRRMKRPFCIYKITSTI